MPSRAIRWLMWASTCLVVIPSRSATSDGRGGGRSARVAAVSSPFTDQVLREASMAPRGPADDRKSAWNIELTFPGWFELQQIDAG